MAMASSSSCSAPDGTRWQVLYSKPASKRKHDGLLALRYVNGPVVKRILLFDDLHPSSLLAERYLKKFEDIVVGTTLSFDTGYLVSVDALVLHSPPRPSPSPSPHFSSSSIPPRRRPPPSLIRTFPPALPSTPHPFRVDQVSVANVGTRWNVLYTRHPNKKSKRTHEGVLRLAQKNPQQQKVVLCDKEGTLIDEQFLGGGDEIACGKTLQFDHTSVEVIEIKEDSTSPAEVGVIREMPADQKRLHRQRPASSFQGMATNDCGEREALQVCRDTGIGSLRNTSRASIQPKRRDSRQILNSLKRPENLSGTSNSCSHEQLEREGTSLLSSVSRRPFEEDCVDHIEKLYVDKACPEECSDDRILGKAENLRSNTYRKKLLSSVRSSPGSYKPAQEFVANLSANRREGLCTNSYLGAVSVDTKSSNMQQEFSVDEAASSRLRSSQAKSAGLVGICLCSEEMKSILDDMHFRVQDFWVGYKLYCFGHYCHCDLSKKQFLASKMGRVVLLLHKEEVFRWGAKFDEAVRQVWVMMEEYIRVRYDKDCTNLRALMEDFEDEKELSTSENGSLLLQLIKDDEQGTEHLYKQAHNVQLESTDIFDQFRRRLNRMDSNLGNLLKSSELNSDLDRHNLGASNSCESKSVGNAINFTVDSRNKSKKWG
ncbi:hypothetical protein M758_7G188500 [Ceratodon purpureus]|uniref:5'-3' DNA helicase ZGRF1-like N-terminal domain-containing protein n=1 Tax=Ceratodon purpureus TaxID=3225 RepID=A0A8T0HA71_CERPU|nr:hypothetical protein KC19_7G191900 [Ceratodon purpureus]KAG0612075.1 hypothetical protein M758_7G188500 [Ceratodon purpureus]